MELTPYEYVTSVFRTLPAIIIISPILYGIVVHDHRAFIFSMMCLSCSGLNYVFKVYIFRPLYSFFQDENRNIPFLGRGTRCIGAMNCGCFIIPTRSNQLSTTFGMPSGHVQITAFFSTFCSLYSKSFITALVLWLMTIYMGMERIRLRCHTVQQVIVGGIIGYVLGWLCFNSIGYMF